MTVLECLESRLAAYEYAPRSLQTNAYLTRLVRQSPLGSMPAEDTAQTRAAARDLLAQILAAGHGRTAEQLYTWLHTCCPAILAEVRRPRFARRSAVYVTADDARRLLSNCSDRSLWLAVAIALSCGLRRGELCGLRWADIDMQACVITIKNQRVRVPGRGLVDMPPKSEAGFRPLPIPRHLAEALSEQYMIMQADTLLCGPQGPYVLPGPTGQGEDPNRLDRAFQALCNASGVRCTLHGLRHTMASIAANNNVPIRVLQSILGHASYTTTAKYYTHTYSDATQRALEEVQKHLTLNQGVPGSSP